MKIKPTLFISALAGLSVWLVAVPLIQAQPTSETSNYTFRFNTGVSAVFLSEMTFENEQPLDLGECTTNEKTNGPLTCAVNCQNESVCLLDLSGPSGSSVNDVLQIASETPASGSPSSSLGSSSVNRRVDAYNQNSS